MNFQGRRFELLTQILREQSMFELIKRLTRFIGFPYQVNPYQKRSTDVIADDTRETTLAFFQTRQLFCLTVTLFNLPTAATHLLCRRDIGLTQVVGHDIIRAPRRRHPENFHLLIFRELVEFDLFARGLLRSRPV